MFNDEGQFSCNRCYKTFKNKNRLLTHCKNNKDIPCDFMCYECGELLQSKYVYDKHKKSGCKFVPKSMHSIPLLDKLPLNIPIAGNGYQKVQLTHFRTGDVNIDNSITNNITIKPVVVMVPHKEVYGFIDKEKLLGEISASIFNRLDYGIAGKANWGNMAFKDVFNQLFEQIYANKDYPEFQNILLKDTETRQLQIFDGKKFVDDVIPPRDRLIKTCEMLAEALKWMLHQNTKYTDRFKKDKVAHINRVISGMPRFDSTYNPMYDKMFKSLENIREDIIERMDTCAIERIN